MPMRVASALFALMLSAQVAQSEDLQINDAWARATPPNVTVGAVFMRIASNTADELLRVNTSVASKAELHSVTERDGRFEMRQLQTLPVPANQAVELTPTGLHIMLVGLKAPLQAKTRFELTLTFKNAGERIVSVSVLAPGER